MISKKNNKDNKNEMQTTLLKKSGLIGFYHYFWRGEAVWILFDVSKINPTKLINFCNML